jgi:CRP-like cAMP-binding protein
LIKTVYLWEERHFSKGDFVFEEGNIGGNIYIVKSGWAFLHRIQERKDFLGNTIKKSVEFREVCVGEVLGEDATIFNQPAQYSVLVGSQGFTCWVAKSNEFVEKVKETMKDLQIHFAKRRIIWKNVFKKIN